MRPICLALVICLLPGCAVFKPTMATCQSQSVNLHDLGAYELRCGSGAGTAVALGGGKFLTCKHLLAPYPTEVQLGTKNALALPLVWGEGEGFQDDWLIFEVASWDGAATQLLLDTKRTVQVGEEMLLVGYRNDGGEYMEANQAPQTLGVFRGTVVAWPFPFASREPGVISVRVEESEPLFGVSGGPALVWDSLAKSYVCVGVQSGMKRMRWNGHAMWIVHYVVRPPL